ncbi:MAG: hypothetical protein HY461_03285 [Parcubacteria group bacterium]|nr:hypothetical protein [Parcubacteria group bacterium]
MRKLHYIGQKKQAWSKTVLAVLIYILASLVTGRRGRALASFFWYARLFDNKTDGGLSPTTLPLPKYLAHRRRLLERLVTRQAEESDLLDEDWLLVHVIVYQRSCGKDGIPELVEMGNAFLTDASRYCYGRPFPTAEQVLCARQAIRLFLAFSLELVGSDRNKAFEFARAFEPFLFEGDNLADLLHDVRVQLINEPQEDLQKAGIDTERLMQCRSWQELESIPGFNPWYRQRVVACRTLWRSAKPEVMLLLKDCIHSRLLRKPFESQIGKIDQGLEECSLRMK